MCCVCLGNRRTSPPPHLSAPPQNLNRQPRDPDSNRIDARNALHQRVSVVSGSCSNSRFPLLRPAWSSAGDDGSSGAGMRCCPEMESQTVTTTPKLVKHGRHSCKTTIATVVRGKLALVAMSLEFQVSLIHNLNFFFLGLRGEQEKSFSCGAPMEYRCQRQRLERRAGCDGTVKVHWGSVCWGDTAVIRTQPSERQRRPS